MIFFEVTLVNTLVSEMFQEGKRGAYRITKGIPTGAKFVGAEIRDEDGKETNAAADWSDDSKPNLVLLFALEGGVAKEQRGSAYEPIKVEPKIEALGGFVPEGFESVMIERDAIKPGEKIDG